MSSKPDLARAGTMQMTAKDGKVFLEKNLTDWKKPYLTDHLQDKESDGPSKPKMAKHNTMKGTAKEAEVFFEDGGRPDADALTRGQQKKIEDISAEKPPAKKAKLAKAGTMAATAKEGKALLGNEKLSDTRQETKAKRKTPMKKHTTIQKTMAEAKAVFGDLDTSEGRRLRKRPEPKKTPLKKAGTMVRTAKEGKAFVKRSKKAEAAKEENSASD